MVIKKYDLVLCVTIKLGKQFNIKSVKKILTITKHLRIKHQQNLLKSFILLFILLFLFLWL